jgi:ferric-dicitrate binding protein FerR (iron transport regulator)
VIDDGYREPRPRARRPRPRRRRRWIRALAVALLLVVVFLVGISLGKALEDSPPAGTTETRVRTLEPIPQTRAVP